MIALCVVRRQAPTLSESFLTFITGLTTTSVTQYKRNLCSPSPRKGQHSMKNTLLNRLIRVQATSGQKSATWIPYKPLLNSGPSRSFLSSRKTCFRSNYYHCFLSKPTSFLLLSLSSKHRTLFASIMGKNLHDTEGTVKDQLRESYCKEAYDDKAPKHVSDYLLPHILNLYGSQATPQDFEIYAPEATFEDPLMRAQGVKEIKSAFYSLGKVFKESRIVEYSIKENVTSPGKTEILIDNKQYYKFLGKDIDMISLIKLYTEDGKVVRHEDLWDKKPLKNGETISSPLLGRLTDATKRVSMFATHALMRFGKDPTV